MGGKSSKPAKQEAPTTQPKPVTAPPAKSFPKGSESQGNKFIRNSDL